MLSSSDHLIQLLTVVYNFNVHEISANSLLGIPLHNWLLWGIPSFNLQATPIFELALEQQRTNLRLKMAESTTLNAASSPQLMDGLTPDDWDRV